MCKVIPSFEVGCRSEFEGSHMRYQDWAIRYYVDSVIQATGIHQTQHHPLCISFDILSIHKEIFQGNNSSLPKMESILIRILQHSKILFCGSEGSIEGL